MASGTLEDMKFHIYFFYYIWVQKGWFFRRREGPWWEVGRSCESLPGASSAFIYLSRIPQGHLKPRPPSQSSWCHVGRAFVSIEHWCLLWAEELQQGALPHPSLRPHSRLAKGLSCIKKKSVVCVRAYTRYCVL